MHDNDHSHRERSQEDTTDLTDNHRENAGMPHSDNGTHWEHSRDTEQDKFQHCPDNFHQHIRHCYLTGMYDPNHNSHDGSHTFHLCIDKESRQDSELALDYRPLDWERTRCHLGR
jgi:hypothetical protein